METLLNPRRTQAARAASRALSAIVILGGLFVLIGWVLDIPEFKSVLPGLVTMKPNTALSFLLVGVSILFLQSKGGASWRRGISTVCASAVAVLGLLILSEYLGGWDLRIDEALFPDPQVAPVPPGRMAISTAVSFFLVGISVLLLASDRLYHSILVAQFLGVAVAILSILALLGYAYGIEGLYDAGPYSAMALHTALLFAFLSAGLLLARAEKGFMVVAASDSAGGFMVRQLLPQTVAIQALAGWIVLKGQMGNVYGASFAVALLVTLTTIVVAGLVLRNAWTLHQSDIQRSRAETERKRAEEGMRQSERRFRALIENSQDAVTLIDVQGVRTYVSPAAARLLGYAPEELVGRSIFENVHPEYRDDTAGGLAVLAKDPGGVDRFEFRKRRRDGTWRWLEGVRTNLLLDPDVGAIVINWRDVTERKQAEERLRESEERFSGQFQLAGIGVAITSPQKGWIRVNRRLCEILGYDEAELRQKTWAEMTHPEDLGPDTREFDRALSGAIDSYELDKRLLRKDGGVVDIHLTVGCIRNPDGKVKYFIASVEDITKRKQAEQLGRLDESCSKTLLELSQKADELSEREIIETGLEEAVRLTQSQIGYFHFVNDDQSTIQLHAWSRKAIADCTADTVKHYPFDQAGVWADCARLRRPVIHNDYRNLEAKKGYPEGHVRLTRHLSLPLVGDGKVRVIVGVGNKASDYDEDDVNRLHLLSESVWGILRRKRAGEALIESEALLRESQSAARIGSYLADLESGRWESSTALDEILGIDETFPRNVAAWYSLIHPDYRHIVDLRFQETRKEHRRFEMDYKILRPSDGVERWVLGLSEIDYDENNEPVRIRGTVQDITERKQTEEQLLRAQRLEMAGRVAGQVAHDFNNLLSPLVAYPELLKLELPEGHHGARLCDSMIRAARQMAEINDDLLTLSRRGHFKQEPADLGQLVEQAMSQLAPFPATLVLELDLSSDLLPVIGSGAQLLRVVHNLISNAREAMGDTGTLRLKAENVYLDAPFPGQDAARVGEYVRLQVIDSGCGIPVEIRDKIFDPFFTTKRVERRRGSGLGLSVVQAIVQDHHGHIDLESEVGKGTTFSVYLAPCLPAPIPEPDGRVRGGSETVLIVDDDALQHEVAGRVLRALGYTVQAVSSGEEAVAFLREQPVDILLLDMIVPDGMDGMETYQQVLEVRPGQKAIIVSGYAESERVQWLQSLGAGAFLQKPTDLKKLAQAVREELDRRTTPEEPGMDSRRRR